MEKTPHILGVLCIILGLVYTASAAPATHTQSVTHDGETITLQLKKENLRGANFEVLTQNAAGGYDAFTSVVAERSYLGTVDEYPGAVSCGIFQDDGSFKGAVYFDRGHTWFFLDTAVIETRGDDYVAFSNYQVSSVSSVTPGHGGSTTYSFELAIDADYDYFAERGSEAKVIEVIEYSICAIRAIYMRDVLLRPYLGRIIIRTTEAQDPYVGVASGQPYLSAVRSEWNTNQTDVNPDLVAGISPTKIGGGLAYVSQVGTSNKYSVNQTGTGGVFDVVSRHEIGHNWGCGHFLGGAPEGTGIMGGNQPGRFSGPEVQRMLVHRDNKRDLGGILEDEGTFTNVELPPYASMDSAIFVQKIDSAITVEVLANDHDANGQVISLLSHDSASAQGGTVIQQGQKLAYIAPDSYLGTDHFLYTITDSAGKTATGVAIIDVIPSDCLRLHLPLEEAAGTTTADESLYNNPAELSGTNFISASTGATTPLNPNGGKFGSAVNLDGVDDHVTVTEMNLDSNTVTMTAWIRQGAVQNEWAGIIFDNTGHAAGLTAGPAKELRYFWDGPVNNWSWSSGLTPPDDTWTFVALVIEPTKATLYMNDGSGFQSSVRNTTHYPVNFNTTYIGWESSRSERHFAGSIDDARIYCKALSQTELEAVFEGGGAEKPSPAVGESDVTSSTLSWQGGLNATSHDVYLGTSESAVASADTLSPEFKGSTTIAEFGTPLADQTQYYWRVDTVTASGTLKGRIWSFTTGTLPGAILINFGDGGSQTLAGSELIGPTGANSSNWNDTSGNSGSQSALIDNAGVNTGAAVQWTSTSTGSNNDGTADDQHRMAVGYLSDQTPVQVTLTDIPYASYRVYGLFTSDQNQATTGSCNVVNFNVNGTLALGGTPLTTAAAWGTITSNKANNGSFWTRIVPGSVQGNYWTVDSTGATCSIAGAAMNGTNRGSLTAVIIQDTTPPTNNPPIWTNSPISEVDGDEGVAYSSTLADDAVDPNAGDSLTFSKVSGPAWLNIAANGDLTGTPAPSDSGANQWVVRATDNGGLTADATLNIQVGLVVGLLFGDDFERITGTTIDNGWIETIGNSRIFDTGQAATRMVISTSAGTAYAIVNQLSDTYVAGQGYELEWSTSRAGSANGTLNYDVSIGTWDGTTFTPLQTQMGSISNVNHSAKIAGPSVYVPASGAEDGEQIAVRFEVLSGSSDWVGFDDIKVNALSEIESWRLSNFDTIDNAGDAADDADPDGDGFTNAEEFLACTDPNDRTSRLQISSIAVTGNDFVISFPTVSGKSYTVEWSNTLQVGSWNIVETNSIPQENIAGTGGNIQVTDTNGSLETRRFYRIIVN